MSVEVMGLIWKTCLFGEGKALNVILAMADWASDDGGDIFPGIDLLAAKSRASVRTTQATLRDLQRMKVISVVANPTGGRGKLTEYQIHLERVRELQGLHEAEYPDCPGCAARRRSEEKRVQARAQRTYHQSIHRTERVQTDALKGAASALKGAESCSRIEKPLLNHQGTKTRASAQGGQEARQAKTVEQNLPRVEQRLGPEGIALLRSAGLTDTELVAWFDGAFFERGPPVVFSVQGGYRERAVRTRFLERIAAAADGRVELRTTSAIAA